MVPFIFAYRPALLMEGPIVSIIQVAVVAIIAVIALAAGLGGYLLKPINYWWRIFLIVGGLLLIHPELSFTITGIGLIAAPALYQLVLPKLRPSHPG